MPEQPIHSVAVENPLIPMSAVTGRPTGEFIRWFMGEFRRVGITQFLFYPRSGCEVEYLSEEWFRIIQNGLEAGEELGYSSIWLYDEFNWPSGQCGGRVMAAREDFALQCLSCRRDKANGEVLWHLQTRKDFPNLLNPDAVDCFIQLTHEEYYRRFGRYFGKLIKGIFSDEPSFGYFQGQEEFLDDSEVRIAWYPELEQEYRERTGRDLRNDLRESLGRRCADTWRYDYNALLGKRFREMYFDRVRKWCEDHGILFTGHLMQESDGKARRYNGDPLLANAGFSLPGMDEIFTCTSMDDIEWQTFGTVEYGARTRGNGGLAELFALGPSDLPPACFRQMIWLAALFGVDHYLLAVSQFQAEGNIHKTYWYHPMSPAQTWFDHYGLLGEDAKAAAAFARKPHGKGEIEIYYPEFCPSLPDILRRLTAKQRPWHFLRKGDVPSPEALAVISILDDGRIFEQKSGLNFICVQDFILYLDIHFCHRFRVFTPQGVLAKDVVLRNYDDGSCVVLDLREADAASRQLHLRIGPAVGNDIVFDLPACGVKVFRETDMSRNVPRWDWHGISPSPWHFALDRRNVLCPEYDAQGRLRLMVAGGVPAMKLQLRSYGVPGEVLLDGKAIAAQFAGEGLPQGIAPLYRSTEEMHLSPGEHLLELAGRKTEYPFLPSLFLVGDFAVGMNRPGEMSLHPLPKTIGPGPLEEQGLRNFVGKVTLSRSVEIPDDAEILRLDTGAHCASVALDERNLGTCLWAPFQWEVPLSCRGKSVRLSVELEVSLAALFGKERNNGRVFLSSHEIRPAGIHLVSLGVRR